MQSEFLYSHKPSLVPRLSLVRAGNEATTSRDARATARVGKDIHIGLVHMASGRDFPTLALAQSSTCYCTFQCSISRVMFSCEFIVVAFSAQALLQLEVFSTESRSLSST